MANHVSFHINIEQMNDAATARFKEMTSNLVQDSSNECWFGDLWVDGKDGSPTSDEVRQYEWTCNNIGPKWAHIHDFDDNTITGYSAWSAPEMGVDKILIELSKLDPKMITYLTYDDEMPNFVGCYIYEGNEMVDGFEDDADELRDRVIAESERLTEESWDEENDDWVDDETRDIFDEEMWEVVNDAQIMLIERTMEMIKDDQQNA